MNSYIELKAPVALIPATAGATPSRVEGTAYSGNIVPNLGVVIDLSTTTVADRLPLLSEHDRQNIVGAITKATIEGGALNIEGRLFSDLVGSLAEKIGQLAQRGAPYQMSVGLYSFREDTIPSGQVATVNSRTVMGPATVLRNGVVREVSLVTLGADPHATARLFGQGVKPPPTLNVHSILARRVRQAAGFAR